jgi:hypothetical protein
VEVAAFEGDAVARGGENTLIVCGCFFRFACKEGLQKRGRMRLFLSFCMQRGISGEENAWFPNLSQAGASCGVVRSEAISSHEERQTDDPNVSQKNVHALFFLVVGEMLVDGHPVASDARHLATGPPHPVLSREPDAASTYPLPFTLHHSSSHSVARSTLTDCLLLRLCSALRRASLPPVINTCDAVPSGEPPSLPLSPPSAPCYSDLHATEREGGGDGTSAAP